MKKRKWKKILSFLMCALLLFSVIDLSGIGRISAEDSSYEANETGEASDTSEDSTETPDETPETKNEISDVAPESESENEIPDETSEISETAETENEISDESLESENGTDETPETENGTNETPETENESEAEAGEEDTDVLSSFITEDGFDMDAFSDYLDSLSDEEYVSFMEKYEDALTFILENFYEDVDTVMTYGNGLPSVVSSTQHEAAGYFNGTYASSFVLSDGTQALCAAHYKLTPSNGMSVYSDQGYALTDEWRALVYCGWSEPAWALNNGLYCTSEHGIYPADVQYDMCFIATSLLLTDQFFPKSGTPDAYTAYTPCKQLWDFATQPGIMDSIPNADSVCFNKSTVAAYMDGSVNRTELITYGNSDGTSQGASMTVPSGVSVVKNGTTYNSGQTVTLNEGDSFYVTAPLSFNGSVTLNAVANDDILSNWVTFYHFSDFDNYQSLLKTNWYYPSVSLTANFSTTSVSVAVAKQSKKPELTNGNPCYSFKGAKFGVYASQYAATNDMSRLATLITDDSGYAKVDNLALPASGNYYIKEVSAPPGFSLDDTVYTLNVTAANNSSNPATITIKDAPIGDPMEIIVRKVVKHIDGTVETGKRIAGAVFEVKHYASPTVTGTPDKTWYFITDANGMIEYGDEWLYSDATHHSDALTVGDAGNYEMALGCITVQEIIAPTGYKLDNTITTLYLTEAHASLPLIQRMNEATVSNTPWSEPFSIEKMCADYEGTTKPLKNAGFCAVNVAYLSTDNNGNYIWDDAAWNAHKVKLAQDGSTTMYTDANGNATSGRLEVGTYLIHENVVPDGYKPVDDFIVEITQDSATVRNENKFTRVDQPIPVYLRVVKRDGDTARPIIADNAKFKIWDYQKNKYVSFTVNGSTADTFETVDGIMQTPQPLSFGRYRVEEIEQPDGYYDKDNTLPDGIVKQLDVEIKNGVYAPYIDANGNQTEMGVLEVTMDNTPIYAQIEIQKKAEQRKYDEDTKKWTVVEVPLSNIQFGIYANESIYTLDTNQLAYGKDTLVETITTDATGFAISSDKLLPGKYYLKELNQPVDYVPLEAMEIELNDSADLIDVTKPDGTIKKVYYKQKDILNEVWKPEIETKAKDNATGTKTGVVSPTTTIVDTVEYKCLIVGREYTLTATPILRSTKDFLKDKNGNVISNTITFKPESPSGTVDISVTFDSSLLAGDTVTMFERVEYNDNTVCLHEEIEDYDQSVFYPNIGTQARDSITEDTVGVVDTSVTLYDTVLIENAVVGSTYTITGTLMDKETEEPILQNGKKITSTVTFVADNTIATVELKFDNVNTALLKGKSVVFFESMTENGVEVCSEADIDNPKQTIDFPEVETTALDKVTGEHYGSSATETITVVDTVDCYNLQTGKTYEVRGVLMNSQTGKPILDGDKEITASLKFTAEKKDMTVSLEFMCPSALLQGVTTVCFEDLYHNDKLVYSHSDLTDKSQQTNYPACKSTATNAEDGTHYGTKTKDFKLNDNVEYVNLKPNTNYICKGVLMNLKTGLPLIIDDKPVVAETKFTTIDGKSGAFDVVFTFDATLFKGSSLDVVCFEQIYEIKEDGTLYEVTNHMDLEDLNQTVKFPTIPKTGDSSKVKFFFILAGISLVGCAGCLAVFRRRKVKK